VRTLLRLKVSPHRAGQNTLAEMARSIVVPRVYLRSVATTEILSGLAAKTVGCAS
jgi:hypothetical protein